MRTILGVRSQRLAAWLLLVMVVVSGLVMVISSPETTTASAATAAAQVDKSGRYYAAEASPVPIPTATASPETKPLMLNGSDAPAAAVEAEPWADAWTTESLPAFRWTKMNLDQDVQGLAGVVRTVPMAIGTLFLMLAGVIWAVLLWILRFGLAAGDILMYAAGPINVAIGAIGERILIFIILFIAFILWKSIRLGLSGKSQEAMKTAVKGILILSLLTVVTQASVAAAKKYDPAKLAATNSAMNKCFSAANGINDQVGRQAAIDACNKEFAASTVALEKQATDSVGTVPWFAYTIATAAGKAAAPLANLNNMVSSSENTDAAGNVLTPNCSAYITQLHDTYVNGPGSNPHMATLSALWESTLYQSWTTMAFGEAGVGGYDLPSMSMCHFAEMVRGTPPEQQQAIAAKAYSTVPVFAASAAGTSVMPVFGPFTDMDSRDARLSMTAWVACTYNGTEWVSSQAFMWAKDKTKPEGGYLTEDCQKVFVDSGTLPEESTGITLKDTIVGSVGGLLGMVTGNGRPTEALGNDVPLGEVYSQYGASLVTGVSGGHQADVRAAQSWVQGYKGMNGGERLLQGLLALVTAVFFLLTLGQIGLGLFVAQFMLVVLLMLVPILLIMWLLGMEKQARGATRLTFTLMVSQVFFTMLLVALITLSRVFQQVSGAMVGPLIGSGLVRGLLYGMSPILAFVVIRKLLSMFGMGRITTFSGALGFVAGSAMVATQDPKISKYATAGKGGRKSQLESALSKGPLGKMEKFSGDRNTKWAKAAANPLHWSPGARLARFAVREESRGKRMKNRGTGDFATAVNRMDSAIGMAGGKGTHLKGIAAMAASVSGIFGASKRSADATVSTVGSAVGGGAVGVAAVAAGAGSLVRRILGIEEATPPPAEGTPVPVTAKKDLISAAEGQYAAMTMRQRIESLVHSGQSRGDINRKLVTDALNGDVTTSLGVDGNGNPVVLANPVELGAFKQSLAELYGVGWDQIVAGRNGLHSVRADIEGEELRALPADLAGDTVLWFKKEFRERRENESDDAWLARMKAQKLAAGLAFADGREVDAWSMMGIDRNTDAGRVRIEKWQAGTQDSAIDSFVIDFKNASTSEMIRSGLISSNWNDDRIAQITKERERIVNTFALALNAAQQSIPEYANQIDQLYNNALEKLVEHIDFVEANNLSKSDATKDAVLKSASRYTESIETLLTKVIEAEEARQTANFGGAALGESVDDIMEKAAKEITGKLAECEDIRAKGAAATFDFDKITEALNALTAYTKKSVDDLNMTSEELTRELTRKLKELNAGVADMHVEAAASQIKPIRKLLEKMGAQPLPD